jgi:parvulin-like peptidyl-prolyl isomerase
VRKLLNNTWRLAVVALAVLCVGFTQTVDTIALVNGDPISMAAFQRRVRYARWTTAQQLNQIVQSYGATALTDANSPYHVQYKLLSDLPSFGQQVLDSLITVKLVQQEANKRGLKVTDDEVQQQINAFFGYVPDARPVAGLGTPVDPTAIVQAYEEHRDNYFGQAGVAAQMSQDDLVKTFAEQVLQIKLAQAIGGDIPTQAEQTKMRHILADSEANANVWLAEIRNGAAFADVAQKYSLDSTSAALGGDLGWSPKGSYLAELEAAIWAANSGDLIGPIKTQFGYHILLIEGREVRDLSAGDLARARDVLYQQWLKQTRESAQIQIVDNWQQFIPAEPTLKELGLPEQ